MHFHRRFVPVFIAILGFGIHSSLSLAYEPPVAEMIRRSVPSNSQVSRAIFEIRSTVYNPFRTNGDEQTPVNQPGKSIKDNTNQNGKKQDGLVGPGHLPRHTPDQDFKQKIYWVRDTLLAIETFAMDGTLLHYYFEEKYEPISFNINPERSFSNWDVVPPFIFFLSKSSASWRDGLGRWGVFPERVQVSRDHKGAVRFMMLDAPSQYAIVQRDGFRVASIHTQILGGEKPLRLELQFTEFLINGSSDQEDQAMIYPRTTNFLLDGSLVKQSVVSMIITNPSWRTFPLTRLREEAKKYNSEGNAEKSIKEHQ